MNKQQDKIITFPEGIPGFEQLTKFIFLEEGDGVFYYLQSVEDEEVCLPMVSPYEFVKDYTPTIHESYFSKLGGGCTEDFVIFAVATIRDTLETSTINLQGPILINTTQNMGAQAIVEDKGYKARHAIATLLAKKEA